MNDDDTSHDLPDCPIRDLIATSLQRIISARGGFAVFLKKGSNRYVQFSLADDLCVESVGNGNLTNREILSPREICRLEEMGWKLGSADNYSRCYSPPFPLNEIAGLLAQTLIEIHGVVAESELEVTVEEN